MRREACALLAMVGGSFDPQTGGYDPHPPPPPGPDPLLRTLFDHVRAARGRLTEVEAAAVVRGFPKFLLISRKDVAEVLPEFDAEAVYRIWEAAQKPAPAVAPRSGSLSPGGAYKRDPNAPSR